MSSDASTTTSQTPRQEALDRTLESFPAMFLPRILGIEHLRSVLADSRQRVRDSHKAQMATLGQKEPAEADDMGGIEISGDKTINHYHQGEAKPASPVAANGSLASKLLVGAALAAGGAGAGYVVNDLLSSPPVASTPAVDTDTDSLTDVVFPK